MLGAFVGQAGGHDRAMAQLAHLPFPERDELSPVTLAPRFFFHPQQVHERYLVPEVTVAEEPDPTVFHISHHDLTAGYLLPGDIAVDMMVLPDQEVEVIRTREGYAHTFASLPGLLS